MCVPKDWLQTACWRAVVLLKPESGWVRLFRQTGEVWTKERHSGDDWHGLQVMAVDGAVLRTQDTPELRDHFDSGNTSTNQQRPYLMMRLVALMNVRSHILQDAQRSPIAAVK